MPRDLEKARLILEEWHESSFEGRAARLTELGKIQIDVAKRGMSIHMDRFIDEASSAYVFGCYRSCIFCSAAAVDQAFRHEMLNVPSPKLTYEKVEKMTLGMLLAHVGKTGEPKSLIPFLDEARTLNDVRNKAGVHPLYAPSGNLPRDVERFWFTLAKQEIKALLSHLPVSTREDVERTSILDAEGQYPNLRELLKTMDSTNTELLTTLWELTRENVLKVLALECWKRTRRIVQGLYPL